MDDTWSTICLLVLWICCLHGIHGAPYPSSSNSAEPPGAMKVQNIIVCEGQKAYVSCSSIFDEITVMETMYGRKNPSICVHPSIPSSTVCQEQETQINAQIKGLCEGEHTCEVAANNEFMAKAGTTICPNVYKYLEIKYRCTPRTYYPNVDGGPDNSQSVSEVITAGAGGLGSSSSVSTVTSSSSSSTSVPEITVQEHENTQPVTTATSQASVTPIDTHNGKTPGNDITEEFSQPEGPTDVITETFPANTASSEPAEVNETFKKSETPTRPAESGDEPSEDESASGEGGEFEEQRDVVYDADRR
ncbi:hypothetical protein ACROYT_G007066 [Oculina patagonica]